MVQFKCVPQYPSLHTHCSIDVAPVKGVSELVGHVVSLVHEQFTHANRSNDMYVDRLILYIQSKYL